MSYKSRAKSDGVQDVDGPPLNCSAHGCPCRWSVKIESPLCSYHAWADPVEWPSITERLRRNGAWDRPKHEESNTVADMKKRVRGSIGNATQKVAA